MSDLTLAEAGIDRLFGTRDENLRKIEAAFGVVISARGNQLSVSGDPTAAETVKRLLDQLSRLVERGYRLRPEDVSTAIRVMAENPESSLAEFFGLDGAASATRRMITPRSLNQQAYVKAMGEHDMVIAIGPAGTGKT